MGRVSRLFFLAIIGLAIIGGSLQVCAQQPAVPASHNDVVIKNAVVMTVTHGNIQNGSVYIKDGKIAEEIGLDDGVTALTQLGLIRTA